MGVLVHKAAQWLLVAAPFVVSSLKALPPDLALGDEDLSDPFLTLVDTTTASRGQDVTLDLGWPEALRNRNLIIAGDSNDRNFAEFACNTLKGRILKFSSARTLPRSPWDSHAGGEAPTFTFPHKSRSHICHLTAFNSSILAVTHFGVMGEDPEPLWHAKGVRKRSVSHWPTLLGERVHVRPSQLAKYVWPQLVLDLLPQRPNVFLTQSSLWDVVMFEEVNPTAGPDDFLAWNWSQRVLDYLGAVRDSGLQLERIMWRTNPDCPWNELTHSLQGLQASAALALRKRVGAEDLQLVDWRAAYPVTAPGQCSGIHYLPDGYAAYLQCLSSL